MKAIAVSLSLAALLNIGCASTPMTSNDTAASGVSPVVTTSLRDAPDYILLSAPSQVRTWDFSSTVRGLHVRGTMTNRGMIPAGEIQGSGKFCSEGRDWFSLSDLRVHKSDETPVAPYILGCASGTAFQPASRAIVTQ